MLDAELDGVDAGLATLKPQSLEDADGGDEAGRPDGEEEEEEEEEHRVLPSTKDERRVAKKKLKEDEKKLKVWVDYTHSLSRVCNDRICLVWFRLVWFRFRHSYWWCPCRVRGQVRAVAIW